MDSEKLDKIIKRFWKSKGNSDLYYLGRCADVSWALTKYLNGGEIYTVGGSPPEIAWHTVVKYNGSFWDIRGQQTADQVLMHNPIAMSKKAIIKAGPEAMQHIISLLNNDFVSDTINGLKKAEQELK